MVFLAILSRWLHIVSACVALGGVFFARIVLPAGLAILDPIQREAVHLRARRIFKHAIHTAILLFLLTGTYNTILNWHHYKLDPPLLHMLWGIHLLLALLAISIAFYVLAGKKMKPGHQKLMALNLVVLSLTIAAASTLKWAREKTVAEHPLPMTARVQ